MKTHKNNETDILLEQAKNELGKDFDIFEN